MILILHDNQTYAKSLIKSFINKKVQFIDLSVEDFIKNVKIIDRYSTGEDKFAWYNGNQQLDFANITGVVNFINSINHLYLQEYINEDVHYVQNEWGAYLTFRINLLPNLINPITPLIASGLQFQFPYIYNISKKLNLDIPKFIVSSKRNEIEAFSKKYRYITRNSLFENNNFKESSSFSTSTLSLIEYIEGEVVTMISIIDKTFGFIIKNDSLVELDIPTHIANSLNNLMNDFALKALEANFKLRSDGTFVLYRVSPYPNYTIHNNVTEYLMCKL